MKHSWSNLTPQSAIALQKRLAEEIDARTPLGSFDLVAGLDCSYNRFSPVFFAGVVVWSLKKGTVIETASARRRSTFPYVPGLLSFREAPVLLDAFAKLTSRPDVVMVDGQGYAHPRRFGLACHIGLWLDLPTFGCAKTRLFGVHEAPGPRRSAVADLSHAAEIIGAVVRTRDRVKPVYVSVGHHIDLASTVRVTLECGRGYRIPEPTRLAHQFVNDVRRRSQKHGDAKSSETT